MDNCVNQHLSITKVIMNMYDCVFSMDCSPCGNHVALGLTEDIIILDLIECKQIGASLIGHKHPVLTLKYSNSGTILASDSADCTIRIWDIQKKKQIVKISGGHTEHVMSISFSHDDQYFTSGSKDQTIRIYNCKNYECISRKIFIETSVNCIQYSPNQLQILVSSRKQILFDSKTRKLIKQLIGTNNVVQQASYSFDGTLVVSNQNRSIKIWNAITGEHVGKELFAHEFLITSVALSPDSRFLVTGSMDKTVRLWNFATQMQVCLLNTHDEMVRLVIFSKDGQRIISAAYDYTICLYKIE